MPTMNKRNFSVEGQKHSLVILSIFVLMEGIPTSQFHVDDTNSLQNTKRLQNLALKKPAFQSSTAYGGEANRAVDGDMNTDFHKRHCSHTFGRTDNWLMVDLQDQYNIRAVEVKNRGDCCGYRLKDFTIEVSENDPRYMEGFPQIVGEVCATHKDQVGQGKGKLIMCNRVLTGRYVRIYKPANEELSLCGFMVYGVTQEKQCALSKGFNTLHSVALKKPAFQSSTDAEGDARLAVDGDKSTLYRNGHCTHTKDRTDNWLMVDLQDEYNIIGVELTNLVDLCCSYRLKDFTIEVSQNDPRYMNGFPQIVGEVCAEYKDQVGEGRSEQIMCKQVLTGRFVRIFKPANDQLNLCELDVYGEKAQSGPSSCQECPTNCLKLDLEMANCAFAPDSKCALRTDAEEKGQCIIDCWVMSTKCSETCYKSCLSTCSPLYEFSCVKKLSFRSNTYE